MTFIRWVWRSAPLAGYSCNQCWLCLQGLLCLYWILPDLQCSLVLSPSLVRMVEVNTDVDLLYRYERSWGHLFESFEAFLVFSWPVITVTDACTGRAHIVTRLNSIGAFIKMIKTRYLYSSSFTTLIYWRTLCSRFGETLPQAPNILQVTPFETVTRHLRHVSDYPSYKKLHSTLPAALLSALKARVRAGEPKTIQELWGKRDKTFMAIDFQWSERNEKSVLEWGFAAVRCGHLEAWV